MASRELSPATCAATPDGAATDFAKIAAKIDEFYEAAADQMDTLRQERDRAREQASQLQKAIDEADLVQLFDDLIEFLDDQADADGDSEGFHPNKAMQLSQAVTRAANAFGWEA
jgi:hypothetical protein